MKTNRAALTFAAGAALLALGMHADRVRAQTVDVSKYPTRPIRLVIPFPPGGSNDILGRFIAQKMTDRLGQTTIADNRPGADGIIGTDAVARSAPDGQTLLIISTSYTMNPAIHKLPYDPLKSFAPVSLIAGGPNVIAVTPSLPVNSIKQLVALAKSRPGQVRYASSGIGGFNHFGGELFNTLAGVKMVHIPYKGGGPAMLDVITGQVEVSVGTLIQTLPHIRSGKLKALGVGSRKRSPILPDVPAISEAGVPGYDVTVWWGILAPAGVPEAIVTKLNSTIIEILHEPEMAKRLAAEAAEPIIETPTAFGKLIASDIAKWARVAKQADIRVE